MSLQVLLDILHIVVDLLKRPNGQADYQTLTSLALVSRAASEAAARGLYSRIVVRRNYDWVQVRLRSSLLPHNVKHVLSMDVVDIDVHFGKEMDKSIADAVRAYPNLVHVAMSLFDSARFNQTRAAFTARANRLLSLFVHAQPEDSTYKGHVACDNLEDLVISTPGVGILTVLPEWIRGAPKLCKLRFVNSSIRITPTHLRSLSTSLSGITSFSLGSHTLHSFDSFTHEDLVVFLECMPLLAHLELFYQPMSAHLRTRTRRIARRARTSTLRNLVSLKLNYEWITGRGDVNQLCVFVRQLIAQSCLRALILLPSYRADRVSSTAWYTGLLEHLCAKHGGWLRVLRAPNVCFGRDALPNLFRTCVHLRELAVTVTREVIHEHLPLTHIAPALRSLRLEQNVKQESGKRVMLRDAVAQQEFVASSSLRQLTVNESTWNVSWKMQEGDVEKVVERSVATLLC